MKMDEEKRRATTNYPMVTYPQLPNYGNPGNAASPELTILQEAISRCAVPLVHQLIQQNPKIIHEKGWHGQTALHRACLVGDWSITYLLIEAGADVNATNDFDETPVHYACKRGAVNVVHLLVQRGGNLSAVDKNGMDVAHHTSQTGSVFVLKYLEMQGSKFQSVDRNLQSPLHIACQYGHVESFKFLVKNQRSDIRQADSDGNTAFHIAAREGHSFLCWVILTMFGCSLLHIQNRKGYTPLDLAKQRDKPGHDEIRPILEWLSKKDQNFKVTGPVLAWYWTLFLPCVFYTVLVVLANSVAASYQGPFMMLGLLCLLRILMSHTHRINHVSKWPNPVFAGTFASGLIHTSLLYFTQLLPYTKEYVMFTGVSLMAIFFMYYMYWVVLRRDPGAVNNSLRDSESGRFLTLIDLCVPPKKFDQFCVTCEIVKGSMTKHCKLCNRCFEHMDHHCLFLLTCVAKHNHRLFVQFIAYVLSVMFLFFVHLFLYCEIVYPEMTWKNLIIEMFWTNGWIMSLAAMNIASIVWGINLLRFQLSLISKGSTTVFPGHRESVLTKNERFMNMIYFMIGKEAYVKDPILCAEEI